MVFHAGREMGVHWFQHVHQCVHIEGLGQKTIKARALALVFDVRFHIGREGNGADVAVGVGIGLAHGLEDFYATEVGHDDVQQHDIVDFGGHFLECLVAVFGLLNLAVWQVFADGGAGHLAVHGVVVHDQNAQWEGCWFCRWFGLKRR